jgi:hypothetical protein
VGRDLLRSGYEQTQTIRLLTCAQLVNSGRRHGRPRPAVIGRIRVGRVDRPVYAVRMFAPLDPPEKFAKREAALAATVSDSRAFRTRTPCRPDRPGKRASGASHRLFVHPLSRPTWHRARYKNKNPQLGARDCSNLVPNRFPPHATLARARASPPPHAPPFRGPRPGPRPRNSKKVRVGLPSRIRS